MAAVYKDGDPWDDKPSNLRIGQTFFLDTFILMN